MMHRNMTNALRQALAALHAGQFEAARDLAAPWVAHPSGGLLHALARGGAGDIAGAACAMAPIAAANPTARHPVCDLVDLLQRHGQGRHAEAHIRAALGHRPHDPALYSLLGATLAETGPISAAIDAFRHATVLAANDAQAWSNLGKALAADGRYGEAWPAFAAAARLAPFDGQVGLNHAIALLKAGRWTEGWPPFRARHAMPGRPPPPPGPEATIGTVAGRTILLVHEEGFGDTIQFIRYVPLLIERGATVLAWVPPPLARLLQRIPGLQTGTTRPPRYDAWCRITDLPGLFATTPDDAPATLPYLSADPALVAAWAARLPPRQESTRRVGLVWAGASRPHDPAALATDRARSIPVGRLGPLLETPGITWIGLQKDAEPPPGVWNPMPDVQDFADTAAIMMSLDLVVSVDTAPAHLAAALGRPVLLLDRYDNCWRWLGGRTDSPWYPGRMQIIRQPTPGDWDAVLQAAAARLVTP